MSIFPEGPRRGPDQQDQRPADHRRPGALRRRGRGPCLTISAGIAFREDLAEDEDLFKCADIALLQVKERGRRGSAVYEK